MCLIFLDFQGDFLYIGIQDQKLVLQIYTGGDSYLSISSKLTYNDNKWHTVVTERDGLMGTETLAAFKTLLLTHSPQTNASLSLFT